MTRNLATHVAAAAFGAMVVAALVAFAAVSLGTVSAHSDSGLGCIDANANGAIERNEVINVITAYFTGSSPCPQTATPDPNVANLWVALYPVEWCAPCIGASANPAFDVLEFGDLDVTARAGTRSETFFNTAALYADDGWLELSQTLEGTLSDITGVSASHVDHGSLRCERHSTSTDDELIYACNWR